MGPLLPLLHPQGWFSHTYNPVLYGRDVEVALLRAATDEIGPALPPASGVDGVGWGRQSLLRPCLTLQMSRPVFPCSLLLTHINTNGVGSMCCPWEVMAYSPALSHLKIVF